MAEQLIIPDSIDHKLDKISDYIVRSEKSEEIINKILSSIVNHVFKLYEEKGIIDVDEEIAPELKLFWNNVLLIVDDIRGIFNEKEKPFLRTYGEIPCFALQSLYNASEKAGRKELSSKLEPAIWAIENGIFNHKDPESLEKFYKCSTKRT